MSVRQITIGYTLFSLMIRLLVPDLGYADRAVRVDADQLQQIGAIEYRCGDGTFTRPIEIFAPRVALRQFCSSKAEAEGEFTLFIIRAGNIYYPPQGSKRPVRMGERDCRLHGGIAFQGHRVLREKFDQALEQEICRSL